MSFEQENPENYPEISENVPPKSRNEHMTLIFGTKNNRYELKSTKKEKTLRERSSIHGKLQGSNY